MKPKQPNKKIHLTFMDCSVRIEGRQRNIEQQAYSLLAAMVQDRMKMYEVIAELTHEDDEPDKQPKKKKLSVNTELWRAYA